LNAIARIVREHVRLRARRSSARPSRKEPNMLRYRHRTHGLVFAGKGSASRVVAAIARVFNFVFGCIYAAVGLRFVLELLRARRDSGFFRLVTQVSDPLYLPFKDIVRTSTAFGSHPLVWSLVVALVAYALLHGVIRALLRVVSGSN
jgi:hypothetical protein